MTAAAWRSDACNGVAEALKTMSLNINAVEFVPPAATGGADNHAHMNGETAVEVTGCTCC